MNIIRLQASNFKRLKAVSLTFDKGITQITGPNGSGKSSTLDAITTVFGGKRAAPRDPVRHGEEIARIQVDLGTIVIKWSCKAGGEPKVIVESAEGAHFPSPQALLDKLWGVVAFDPSVFERMKPAEQRAELARITGLTGKFDTLNKRIKETYDARTATNRDIKQREAILATIPEENVERVSVAALLEELTAAQVHNRETQNAGEEAQQMEGAIAAKRAKAKEYRERAAKLIEAADQAEAECLALFPDLDEVRATATREHINEGYIRDRIASAESVNATANRQEERALQVKVLEETRRRADEMTAAINEMEAQKAALVAEAHMPIPGLALTDDGITFNGVPFEQASQAERWRVCIAISAALNPKLKVILMREGSLLDSKSLQALRELPELAEYQIIMETVDESGKVGVVMEDGEVVAIDGVPVEQSTEEITA